MRRLACLIVLASAMCGELGAHGDDEGTWNGLHITPATQAQFFYPYDGRAPKIAVLLHNHDDDASTPPVMVAAVRVNGSKIDTPDLSGGGPVVIGPLDVALPSLSAAGVWDGRFGPPPAVGETKTYHFEFDFALAPGATPEDPDAPAVSTLAQDVQFTNLGDSPALGGASHAAGTLRLAGAPSAAAIASTKLEVGSPYSPWLNIPLTPAAGAGTAFSFNTALPARSDLYLRFSADGYDSQVLSLGQVGAPSPTLDVTIAPAPVVDLDYRRATAITTPTGFWRAAVSETEGTFVVFPGQLQWKATTSDADARALRSSGRIAKYRFDGTRLWEMSPGWETWGGDLSADGKYVAYVLNPTARSFYTPAANTLALLDGATGNALWTITAAPDDAAIGRKLEAIEVRFSPDAKWIAVGSLSSGQVSLIDRATGHFTWSTTMDDGIGFGAITRLCFSPDGQFLYCGSKDGHVRQLRVADGAVGWSRLVFDAPHLSGLTLSGDGAWLAVGADSLDLSLIRTSDGMIRWQTNSEAQNATLTSDARYAATDGGQIYNTMTGAPRGFTRTNGVAQFTADGRAILQLGHEFKLFDLGGKMLKSFPAPGFEGTATDNPPWAYVTADGRYAIAIARDLPNPPETSIVIYERAAASANSLAPVLRSASPAQAISTGAPLVLNAEAIGTPPLAYQWQHDGIAIPRAQNASLQVDAANPDDAGNYTVRVTNAAGSIVSAPIPVTVTTPNPADPPRIANLSVRSTVDATPLTVGFAVGGNGTLGLKRLLVRGAGPALVPFGITAPLPDPKLTLFSGSTSLRANDNWAGDADVTSLGARVGAFGFGSATSADAAIPLTTAAGAFSVQLGSADGRRGTALAEIYDADAAFDVATPRLINISGRATTTPGDPLIAGFVVTGSAGKTVLIRGVGPSLAQFGVSGAVSDPVLTLFQGATVLATNDNWYDAANALRIATVGDAAGAFPLETSSRDAAILISLPPGIYSAQVSGNGGTTGDALVEVYEAP